MTYQELKTFIEQGKYAYMDYYTSYQSFFNQKVVYGDREINFDKGRKRIPYEMMEIKNDNCIVSNRPSFPCRCIFYK